MDDVIVIGAGIIGAACAASLTIAGQKVTLIDRVGPGEGCSFGNAGGLSPGISLPLATPGMYSHIPGWLFNADSPLAISWRRMPFAAPWLLRFLLEGRSRQSDVAAEGMRKMMRGAFEDYAPLFSFAKAEHLIHRTGQLYVYHTDESFAEEQSAIRLRREFGVEQEILNSQQLREMEPDLSPRFKAGIFFPRHGHCAHPQGLVRLLVEASTKAGARFVSGEVRRIEDTGASGSGIIVHTEQDKLAARRVVIAAGMHANTLLSAFRRKVPLESQRGYHIEIPMPGVAPRRNVMWAEKKTLATPMDAGLRVAGTAEIAGLQAAPNARRFELLKAFVREMYPRVQVQEERRWMGHRPCTPDSLPVIGPLPGHPHVICAFGHGHVGLTSASFTGRLIRDLCLEQATADEWRPFSIERF